MLTREQYKSATTDETTKPPEEFLPEEEEALKEPQPE